MSRLRLPPTLVLLAGLVVVAWGLTRVLPQGTYERRTAPDGHELVVPGSYHPLDERRDLPWTFPLTAVPDGLAAAQEIVFFILIIGGCFGVLRATGATDAGIAALLRRFGRYPSALIAGTMLAFALGSATVGMAEEYIPFVPVLITLAAGLGLDALTAVGIVYVACGVGYGAAMTNPFTVLVAQDVAGLEPLSGIAWRAALFPLFWTLGVVHVVRHARRVRAAGGGKPAVAGSAERRSTDASGTTVDTPEDRASTAPAPPAETPFTRRHLVIVLLLSGAIAFLVYAIDAWGWYVRELSAYFLGVAIVIAVVARMGPHRFARSFTNGAAELTATALLVGVARAIQLTLDEGKVTDTVIHGIAQPLERLGPWVAAVGMLAVQSVANLFVPSGSGQAFVTMPVMAPLADVVGLKRQVAVLAYQFGDGFTNMIVPTNVVLVSMLSLAGVSFQRWLRFVLPLMLQLWALGAAALVAAAAWGLE